MRHPLEPTPVPEEPDYGIGHLHPSNRGAVQRADLANTGSAQGCPCRGAGVGV
jgi:hypothetical protein